MFKQYINGRLVDGQGPAIQVENPANGETVAAIQGPPGGPGGLPDLVLGISGRAGGLAA